MKRVLRSLSKQAGLRCRRLPGGPDLSFPVLLKIFDPWRADVPMSPKSGRFFYGWWIVVAATVAMLFSIPGQTMGFSVFTEILMEELGLSRVALSAAYCIGTVGSGLTLPYMGTLYDRCGGRQLTVYSAIATALVLFYLSGLGKIEATLNGMLPNGPSSVTGFLLIGLGFYLIRLSAQGVLTMSSRNMIGKWFDRRRGLALAVSGVAVSFSFSAAPTFLDFLIESFGHEGAWAILGALTLVVMAPLAWVVFRDTPEQCGMVMDGEESGETEERNPDMVIYREYTRAEAVRTFTFWVYALSFSFFSCYSTAFTFHIVSIGDEFGFEKSDIIALFVPMAVVSVVVSLFCGWVNSRTRLKWLLLGMNLGAVTGALGLMTLDTPLGEAGYVIGNGVCGGAFMSLSGLVWPRFFGRKWLGSISGMNMSLVVIASGLGPLMFGLTKQLTESYFLILLLSVAVPASLALATFRANNPQRSS